MNKPKNNFYNLLLILFLILIFLILILIIYDSIVILEKQTIHASFTASDHPGFDLNLTALTFGMVPVGQSAGRGVFITNDFDKKIKVIIKSSGEISDFLIVSENSFYLNPHEKKRLDFSVILPEDLDFKKYVGEIEIIFKQF